MAQSEAFHETWAHLRDNAKPVVPNDVWELRAVRDMGPPPSKAFVKRVAKKSRAPNVVRSVPPKVVDHSARHRFNEAAKLGLEISKRLRPNFHRIMEGTMT